MVTRTKPQKRISRKPATRRKSGISFKESQKLYRQVMQEPPLLTKEQVNECEREANFRDWVRRAMWHVLAMPGKEIVNQCRQDRDSALMWAQLSESAAHYRVNLQQLIGFVNNMELRLLVALATRPDMREILDEAKRENESGEQLTADNAAEMLAQHEQKKEDTRTPEQRRAHSLHIVDAFFKTLKNPEVMPISTHDRKRVSRLHREARKIVREARIVLPKPNAPQAQPANATEALDAEK